MYVYIYERATERRDTATIEVERSVSSTCHNYCAVKNIFADVFPVFRQLFRGFRQVFAVSGRARTHSDLFGPIGTHSDAFGRVWKCLNVLGNF